MNYQANPQLQVFCEELRVFWLEIFGLSAFPLFNIRNWDSKLSFYNICISIYCYSGKLKLFLAVLKQVSESNLKLVTCNYIDFPCASWVFFKVTMLRANVTLSTTALQHPNCSWQCTMRTYEKGFQESRSKSPPTISFHQPLELASCLNSLHVPKNVCGA